MSEAMSYEEIRSAIGRLPAAERIALAEDILQSIDPVDPDVDRLWLEEVEARMEAVRLGELALVSAEEVFAKYAPR